MTNWYTVKNIAGIDSPTLLIYKERVHQNIAAAIAMVGDVSRLRPHIKTNKNRATVALMIAAGITKFKCATIAEAELLGMTGAIDVLLAYQPIGPKITRLFKLIDKYTATHFSCLADNQSAASHLSAAAIANAAELSVYIDVNMGMNRTGVAVGNKALALYKYCTALPSIYIRGFHCYDGHIRHIDEQQKIAACNQAFAAVEQMKQQLKNEGYKKPVIIAGGSPTFSVHAKWPEVECSPGTFVYWDKTYLQLCPEQPFVTAALVLGRVISLPSPGLACIDIGHKSIAAENTIDKRITFLNAPNLAFVSQSEEHLVASYPADEQLEVGDVLYGLPHHICPTVALYDSAVVIKHGQAGERWRIEARDRILTI